jgi:hypothetical protein
MKILKEDLKMLKEDLGILAVPLGLLAMWALTKLGSDHPGFPGQKDRPLPNSNVINAINDTWENKPFVKDFAKILSDEGDFNELVKLIRSVKKSDRDSLWVAEDIWKIINSTDFEPNPVAKRIVEKLLKTTSYKGIVRKFKLTKEDEQYFAKLLLFTIMRPEFTKYAKVYILKTLKPLGFLSKAGRNISGYDITKTDIR